MVKEPIKDELNISTITFLWPNKSRRYRLISILLSKFALSNEQLESKMHPAVWLFQLRVTNGINLL